jgi:hypothetical protein
MTILHATGNMDTPAFHDSEKALPVFEHGKSTAGHGNHHGRDTATDW